MCADSLTGFPLTTNLSAWYAHATILVSLFCLALTIYGFKVSLAGRAAFKDLLAEGQGADERLTSSKPSVT